MSEQEELASLVGGGSYEPMNTQSILENALISSLKINNGEIEMQENAQYDDTEIESRNIDNSNRYPVEQILLTLYDVHDNLTSLFESVDLGSDSSKILSDEINKIGSCIVNFGGEVEYFDPLSRASGLELPNSKKNAEEVVNRTIKYYRSGSVTEAKISEDGTEISITFEGDKNGVHYTASGKIYCHYWDGNEAIDYVYMAGDGKMSVKYLDGGKWIIKEDCKVSWELNEKPIDEDFQEDG